MIVDMKNVCRRTRCHFSLPIDWWAGDLLLEPRAPSSLCRSVSRGVYLATECDKHTHTARGRELLLMFDLCVREGGGRVAVKSRQRWRLQAAMRRLSGDQATSHIYWDYWRAQNLQTEADPMPSPSNTDVLWEISTLCSVCGMHASIRQLGKKWTFT